MTASERINTLVDATPDTRDRYVDFLRAASLAVVVIWHWVFSITHWNRHDQLTMPNPIGGVPLLWLATWVLQIIPVFFFVGGFSNLTSWRSQHRRGHGDREFLASRLRRLLRPVAVFIASWTVVDLLIRFVDPSTPSVLHWGSVVFVPLWFLGVYAVVVLLVPVTARLHERVPLVTVAVLASAIALVDLARFQWHIGHVDYLNVALVFLFAHQLGYFYADGTLTGWTRSRIWALTLVGAASLVLLTRVGYPVSMVATQGGRFSNMNPPSAAIAALAVLQVGLAMLIRPAANRWLSRRRPWQVVVAANGITMTVFAWHMTAYVIALWIVQCLGGHLQSAATASWWLERPLWLVLPALCLAGLVAVTSRFE